VMRVAASKLEVVSFTLLFKELTHGSDSQPQFYRLDLASALPRSRVEQRSTGYSACPFSQWVTVPVPFVVTAVIVVMMAGARNCA
jgi:hypothetical protein